MAYTSKQRKRQRWSAHMRRWFGAKNDYARELDANNRGVEKRKRAQYRHQAQER